MAELGTMRDLVPKRHVVVENGQLVVTVDTLADHRLALKELKLLRKEFQLQKREAAWLAKPDISRLKYAARKRLVLPVDPDDASMLPAVLSDKYLRLAKRLEEHVRSFDSLMRAVDSMEIQIRAAIYRLQYK
jgi:hypothetical protein